MYTRSDERQQGGERLRVKLIKISKKKAVKPIKGNHVRITRKEDTTNYTTIRVGQIKC